MKENSNSQNNRRFSKERPRRDGEDRRPSGPRKKSFSPRRNDEDGDSPRPKRAFDREGAPKRSFDRDGAPKRGFGGEGASKRSFDRDGAPKRGFDKSRPGKPFDKARSGKPFDKQRSGKPYDKKFDRPRRTEEEPQEDATPRRDVTSESKILSEIVAKRRSEGRFAPQKVKIRSLEYEEQFIPVRLNKYIANAGVCSRREADTLIEAGAIKVNGEVVTELGFKVKPTDEVRFGDKVLQREKPMYVLLNKPKDYITTMYDEFNRKHVMQLIKGACKERVYPVGRLDRDTTGLLLFTNDGDMAKKLTHPRSEVRKIYHVTLNKNLKSSDMEQIAAGIELDDGRIVVDEISYVAGNKDEIGVTIHSGKNRIVRRIFESFGYEVVKLDRVVFAGLTKKDLPRGAWRLLSQAEINLLKMTASEK